MEPEDKKEEKAKDKAAENREQAFVFMTDSQAAAAMLAPLLREALMPIENQRWS